LLARFEAEGGYLSGERWLYVIGTWHAALAFWPFGSGLGSYAAVFPAFQPIGVHGFIEHAHNDYVQLLMECGLLAVAFGALALALIARQTARLVRRARRAGLDAAGLLQASCGLGLLAVLLHSWVEFNLRIPANAMLATFLLGAFLRPLPPHRDKSARESVLE
jgi:O-antigen ligase